jgi:hypothetical protein
VPGRDEEFKEEIKRARSLAGGKVLLPGGPPVIVRTSHMTTFQNSNMDLNVSVDDEGLVAGYVMRILEPMANHLYVYAFGQETLDSMKETLAGMPNVGERVPEDEEKDKPVLQ